MNEPLNNLKQAAQHIRLSHDEKAVMRAQLFAAIEAKKYAPVATYAVFTRFSYKWATSFAVLVIFVLGGGTAYAAQGALPGSPLYPVKIYVNEGVAQALATSPEAKIAVNTNLAETRLKEAEALAAQGRLDATTTSEIENNLDQHLAQASTMAQALQSEDASAAVEASVRIESSLAAHSAILEQLGAGSNDVQTQENSARVALRVRSLDQSEMQSARIAMRKNPEAAPMLMSAPNDEPSSTTFAAAIMQPATTSSSTTRTGAASRAATTSNDASDIIAKGIATQLKMKAQSELAAIEETLSSSSDTLSATTSAKVQDGLTALQQRMDTASGQLEQGNYVDARANFTSVLRDAIELSALVEASNTFKFDFIHADTSDDNGGGGDGGSQGTSNGGSHGHLDFQFHL